MWLSMGKAREYANLRREDFQALVAQGEIPSSFGPNGQRKVDTADIDAYYRRRRFWTPASPAGRRA